MLSEIYYQQGLIYFSRWTMSDHLNSVLLQISLERFIFAFIGTNLLESKLQTLLERVERSIDTAKINEVYKLAKTMVDASAKQVGRASLIFVQIICKLIAHMYEVQSDTAHKKVEKEYKEMVAQLNIAVTLDRNVVAEFVETLLSDRVNGMELGVYLQACTFIDELAELFEQQILEQASLSISHYPILLNEAINLFVRTYPQSQIHHILSTSNPLQTWEIDNSAIKLSRKLYSSDKVSKLYTGKLGSKVVLIRCFREKGKSKYKSLIRECTFLSTLPEDNNIWKMKGACLNRKNLQMVMEMIPRGSMADPHYGKDVFREALFIVEENGIDHYGYEVCSGDDLHIDVSHNIQLTHAKKLRIAISIAEVMGRLHYRSILYMNLRPENIMLDNDWEPKLSNFSLHTIIGEVEQDIIGKVMDIYGPSIYTNPRYLTPEAPDYDTSYDMYAFGSVLWELFCHKHELEEFNEVGNYLAVPELSENIPIAVAEIIARCWNNNFKDFAQIRKQLIKSTGDVAFSDDENMIRFWGRFKRTPMHFSDFKHCFSDTVADINPESEAWAAIKTSLLGMGSTGENVSLLQLEKWFSIYGPITDEESCQWIVELFNQPWYFGEQPLRVAQKRVQGSNRKGSYIVTLNNEKFSPAAILTFLPKRDVLPVNLIIPINTPTSKTQLVRNIKAAIKTHHLNANSYLVRTISGRKSTSSKKSSKRRGSKRRRNMFDVENDTVVYLGQDHKIAFGQYMQEIRRDIPEDEYRDLESLLLDKTMILALTQKNCIANYLIAKNLVYIWENNRRSVQYIEDICRQHLNSMTSVYDTFQENSFALQCMTTYARLISVDFIRTTLSKVLQNIYDSASKIDHKSSKKKSKSTVVHVCLNPLNS
eukprot:TRINITY_DN3639_c0_g1_i2.p1 TRINITY_DN3639_c0_g1~~TRINITY_DN3639_c0_g1_i2.p1  ORF type:complete len:876 (+),score=171.72 TRINITY_DN3639_c0_g1_i2:2550-5177(+)